MHFLKHTRVARAPSRSPLLRIQQHLEVLQGVCPRSQRLRRIAGQQHRRDIRVAQGRGHNARRPLRQHLQHEGHHMPAVPACPGVATESTIHAQIASCPAARADHRQQLVLPTTAHKVLGVPQAILGRLDARGQMCVHSSCRSNRQLEHIHYIYKFVRDVSRRPRQQPLFGRRHLHGQLRVKHRCGVSLDVSSAFVRLHVHQYFS